MRPGNWPRGKAGGAAPDDRDQPGARPSRHQAADPDRGPGTVRRAGLRQDLAAGDRRTARRHQGRAVLPLQVQGRHRGQPGRGLLRPDRRPDRLGQDQPRTPASRAQVLDRYYRIVAEGSSVFRMLQQQPGLGATAWRTPRTAANCSASGWTPWSASSPRRTRRWRARSAPRWPGQRELRLHVLRRPRRRPERTAGRQCSTSPRA